MDCVIPGPSVRLFCSSIACLSKIGNKDLYVELDVAHGVTLRTLNDAKSAYACMRFAPSFFERCSALPPPTTTTETISGRKRHRSSSRSRLPTSPSTTQTTASTINNDDHDDEDDDLNHCHEHDDNDDERRFSVRLAVRAMAPIVKARKDVVQLRITSRPSPLRLAFEFLLRPPPAGGGGGRGGAPLLRVVHGIPACDADAVAAITTAQRASEFSCRPSAMVRWLEPLSRLKTTEVAIIIEKDAKALSAQSFHHGEWYGLPSSGSATTATTPATAAAAGVPPGPLPSGRTLHVVKTEACLPVDELEDVYFYDTRGNDDNDEDEGTEHWPDRVNEGVVLVIPLREARAWLQFCAMHADTPRMGRCATVTFHWGGKPVVLEAASPTDDEDHHGGMDGDGTHGGRGGHQRGPPPFSSQLVLASLDHHLLRGR